MKNLRNLGAAVALAAILPLATAGASFAADVGPGPCTPPAGDAVGAAGPAMNGGQLMAGVGQCQRIENGSWNVGYVAGAYPMMGAAPGPYVRSSYPGPAYPAPALGY